MSGALRVVAVCSTAGLLVSGTSARVRRAPEPSRGVRLVVLVVADQFRADYLDRFRARFTGGLKTLLDRGAVFPNTFYRHAATETAPGHAAIATGRHPTASGIIGNSWYDRAARRAVLAIDGPPGRGEANAFSPERLLVPTLGDWLKQRDGRARVLAASLKDRSAILLGGHRADFAYWYDARTGAFVTGSFYRKSAWVDRFDERHLARSYFGRLWTPLSSQPGVDAPDPADAFRHAGDRPPPGLAHAISDSKAPDPKYFSALEVTPFGDAYLLDFLRELNRREQPGRRGTPDLLAVSFSSLDFIGHVYGPDSPEVEDEVLRLDRRIGELLEALAAAVGADHLLVAFTSDHGVMPLPEVLRARGVAAERVDSQELRLALARGLTDRFGGDGSKLIESWNPPEFYLSRDEMAARQLAPSEVERAGAAVLGALPPVARVYTRTELTTGRLPDATEAPLFANAFRADRSGDLLVQLKRNYLPRKTGTTHGSPYDYDTHVPMIVMGGGVRAGTYPARATVNDLAPTLGLAVGLTLPVETGASAHPEIFTRAEISTNTARP